MTKFSRDLKVNFVFYFEASDLKKKERKLRMLNRLASYFILGENEWKWECEWPSKVLIQTVLHL